MKGANFEIADDQYQPTLDEEDLRLRFAAKGHEVTIVPKGMPGSYETMTPAGRL